MDPGLSAGNAVDMTTGMARDQRAVDHTESFPHRGSRCDPRGMRSALLASVLLLAASAPAFAHIQLTSPMPRPGDQKEQHCGVANSVRDPARVTTFRPGETITVTWLETINHPGYYRIAFQPNGSVFGIPAARPGSCNGNVACPAGVPDCDMPNLIDNTAGASAGGSIILKDRIADGLLSTTVTLPNMECNNCTLQFIQVMTDKCPYTVDAASNDIYFNCADITLSNTPGAPDAGPGAGPDAGAGGPDAGTGTGTVDGGCSTSGSGGLAGTALLAGLFALRRRRRS